MSFTALRQKLGSGLSPLALADRVFVSNDPKTWLVLYALTLVLLVVLLIPLLSGGGGTMFLLAPLAAMGGLWLIRQPHWGVLISLTVMFVELPVFFGVNYLISAALAVPLALAIVRDRGFWLLRVPQIQLLLLIALLLLISTLWNEVKYPITLVPDKDQTDKQTREFITQFIWLVFFLYFISTRRLIELSAKLMVVLVSAAALSGLFLFVSSGGADRAAAAFSLAKNSNRLAYISLFATSLVWFYRSYAPTHRWKRLTLPLLLCLPLTALTAGSRSGLLQIITLGGLVLIDQKGWSPAKRVYCVLGIGVVALLILAVVPSSFLERATRFDPAVDAPGQESLQNRVEVVGSAFKMIAADPFFGAGFGNFTWVARAFFGSSGATHNSYLWASVSGGVGVLGLYLLLFYATFRMLRRLEKEGPRELLWLSKALRVNMITFLIFSAFADFWLSDFLYLMIGLSIVMTRLWLHQERRFESLARGVAHAPDVTPLRLSRSLP